MFLRDPQQTLHTLSDYVLVAPKKDGPQTSSLDSSAIGSSRANCETKCEKMEGQGCFGSDNNAEALKVV